MAEMVLPGVYIEVRPEGLITAGRVTVGNLGVVGTANKGQVGVPVILGSYTEAREQFGNYDPFGTPNELTLVRALELAYNHGAATVIAVRVASGTAAKADFKLRSSSGDCCRLTAKSEGEWGNEIEINVWDAEENSFVSDEMHSGGGVITLTSTPIQSARNRISVFVDATKRTKLLNIVYNTGGPPASGGVDINTTTRALTFNAAEVPAGADTVTASYVVDKSVSRKVTLRYRGAQEVYTVASGRDLVADIARTSVLVDGTGLTNQDEPPTKFSSVDDFQLFGAGTNTRGDNGAVGANYKDDGLEKLLNEPAHIIVAAGQDNSFGDELDAHCQQASTDLVKRDRIAVVGSALGASLDSIRGHTLDSDRVIFVAPGITVTDAAATPPVEVTLPGAYAAAAVAGLLAGLSAHISPTNKTIHVGGLQRRYTAAELSQLVQSRVLALEERQGFRIVKGITTSSNTAWHQITTRRIVDFAKYGVRSAANPYIGRLNNERVRGALKSTINSFLTEMVDDEMLVSYELEVSATRDEEIKGIARVTLVLRPTFSIDFVKVTMFLF